MKNLTSSLSLLLLTIILSSCSREDSSSSQSSEPIIDLDGNEYQSLRIGDDFWLDRNLNVSHYRNGDEIPHIQDPQEWAALTTGAWCYYDNITANGEVYGKLYNWYAVNDERGIAPDGWHVASDNDWSNLLDASGGVVQAGNQLKSVYGWNDTNTDVTNQTAFTALPGGRRGIVLGSAEGVVFDSKGDYGFWWSSTEDNGYARTWILMSSFSGVGADSNPKSIGFSVRCVRD